jgi:AraC-like DNA-binding protein
MIPDTQLIKICEYVKDNIQNKFSMQELENLTGISARAIQFKFKKQLNKTPFQYIEEQKLLKAFEIIQACKKEKSVTCVANDVGLHHLGRFSIKFKKRFGVSASHLAKL